MTQYIEIVAVIFFTIFTLFCAILVLTLLIFGICIVICKIIDCLSFRNYTKGSGFTDFFFVIDKNSKKVDADPIPEIREIGEVGDNDITGDD